MAKEYVNVRVRLPNGRTYRVAFHVGTGRVMIVGRQPLKVTGKEAAIEIGGRTGQAAVALARPLAEAQGVAAWRVTPG